MADVPDSAQRILDLARRESVFSARDIRELGIHPEYLRRLCARGDLVRIGRGLYSLPDAEATRHHSLAMAAKAVPHGVVCLISALSYHDIGTQVPHEVWMAVPRRTAMPRVDVPTMRVFHFSGRAFTAGVEEHAVEGVPVRLYCPAKTVADCFKFRNQVGLDVALEALREFLSERKGAADDILRYARACRVEQVVRPYMEAMV